MSTDDVLMSTDDVQARLRSVLGLQEAAHVHAGSGSTSMHSDACTQMRALRCMHSDALSGPSAPVEQDRVHEHAIRHVIRDAITCHQHLWSKIGSTNMQPWKSQPATNDWRKTAR